MDFLLSGKTGILYKPLYQYCTYFAVFVLSKANHTIRTRIKVLVVCLDTLEKRCKIVIGIAEIIQLNDFRALGREIDFVLGTSVEEVAKLAAVGKPAALLLGPLTKPYQLD